jgi:O-antigen biosynthesis protein
VLDQHDIKTNGAGAKTSAVRAGTAAWLGPSALLLTGASSGQDGTPPSAVLRLGDQARAAETRVLTVAGTNVLVVAAPDLEAAFDEDGVLELRHEDSTVTLDAALLEELGTNLQGLLRKSFAPLDAAERRQVADFLAATTGDVPADDRPALSERLESVNQALRERLPTCVVSEHDPHGIHLDRVLLVDDSSFYLLGWLHDQHDAVTRVTAVSPEGARVELLDQMHRYPRHDVASLFAGQGSEARDKHGFLCFVRLAAPSLLEEGWLLEMETADGDEVETGGPPVVRDAITVRDAILDGPELHRPPDDDLMEHHVYPAITSVLARIGEPKIERVLQFGEPPSSPEVSIVIPVYKRLDHLEMQLAEFVRDPEISEADLIYVLDSPEQEEEFLQIAAQLTPLYGVPFRVVVLERNAGFGVANNIGAALAIGRSLLLMNSDILPDRPGWLSRMHEFYESVPHIGALGVKLLYEDDSIQHAGMYFYKPPGADVWVDAHYYKGMHRSLPAANVARAVPLISGACLMIDRALYEELGGLRSIYVRGDYEDSDLCLQLMDSGRENWYLPDVELYHLEGQSYVVTGNQTGERYTANRYNSWVHSHLWRDRIEEIMRKQAERNESARS